MSDVAVAMSGVGKMYKLFRRRRDKVFDALGLAPLLFWRRSDHEEFWALRDITLTIPRGERLGIIGRNGAGKTTLLKLIAGLASATEGHIAVNGPVQALMELGTGFHPEFTGRENVQAALAYQGLRPDEIAGLEEDIVAFAELGGFIDQPIRTYSTGMYTRLAFSVATAIKPAILILDEVLGVGDAYFAGKCIERMRSLTEDEHVTVLFVSHATSSVERICNRCVWIEQGRLVMDGPTMTVTSEYERHIRLEEDRRLTAKNRRLSLTDPGQPVPQDEGDPSSPAFRHRWPGSNELLITRVWLLSGAGEEQAVFSVGEQLILRMRITAQQAGPHPVVFCAVLYRLDGLRISCHLSEASTLDAAVGESREVELDMGALNLGNGGHVFSVAIYRELDPELLTEPQVYDLHERIYEFRVVGRPAVDGAIFRHPSSWRMVAPGQEP